MKIIIFISLIISIFIQQNVNGLQSINVSNIHFNASKMNTDTKVQKEIFKSIANFPLYQVSDLGNVVSLKFGKTRTLKKIPNSYGYLCVHLSVNNVKHKITVHQLVSIAFLNHVPCKFEMVVNHKNFNIRDNRVENLEVVSNRENTNKKHIKSSSKYVGVYFRKDNRKYVASIDINGKGVHLGMFENEYDAHIAYQNKLKQL